MKFWTIMGVGFCAAILFMLAVLILKVSLPPTDDREIIQFPHPLTVPLSLPEDTPVTPTPIPPPIRSDLAGFHLVRSVSQYGITWMFDKDYPVGRFVNGDWWVVGPTTITTIDPPPVSGRNGSMINPCPGAFQAYDDRIRDFDPASGIRLPLHLSPGQSLVSTCSGPQNTAGREKLITACVLTCLGCLPRADTFRPAYCGSEKKFYYAASLRKELLKRLPPVAHTPTLPMVEKKFERVWLDHKTGWSAGAMHPRENMPWYGREIAGEVATAGMMLNLDLPDKDTLLIRFVQLGIDLFGIVENGGSWPPDGGHACGRKLPILVAGLLLDDPDMLNIGFRRPHVHFGEDCQTFYITRADIARPLLLGNTPYPPETWGLAEWGIRHCTYPYQDDFDWAAGYRNTATTNLPGIALTAHILGLKTAWNNNAFFDYLDRKAAVENKPAPADFKSAMWQTYRNNYPPVYTQSNYPDTVWKQHSYDIK